jgi:hypothetical protein
VHQRNAFCGFCVGPTVSGPGHGAEYTYTAIGDLSSCYSIGSPVLNNKGEAAFFAQCSSGSQVVVRRGDFSGSLVDIYMLGPGSTFGVFDSVISINDEGAVAFTGWTSSSSGGLRTAILVGDGGPVSAVVDTDLSRSSSR